MEPLLEVERTLPRRVKARRWSYDGAGPRTFASTAHKGFEVAVVHQGAVSYRVDGATLEVGPGCAAIVPCGVDHATTFLPGAAVSSLHIDDDVLAGAAAAARSATPERAGIVPSAAALSSLSRMLLDELVAGTHEALLCADALVEALVLQTLRAAPVTAARAFDPRITAAVERVRDRVADPIDVDELAAIAGMSRFHFSRAFKAALGKSPYQFVVDARLEEAARRLSRGGSVTDAALSSGFTDLSRFARMFRAHFGTAPSGYRASAASMSSSSMRPSASMS